MTIEKCIDYFLLSLEQMQLSVHTLRAYQQDLNQWKGCMTKNELDILTFEDFQEYLIHLQTLNLKPNSLKRKRVVLHRFLKYCYNKKLTSKELFAYIDPIKAKKYTAPKEILTQEEISHIYEILNLEIEHLSQKLHQSDYTDYLYYCAIRNRLLVTVLLYTGCRAAEAVAIKKEAIRFDQNTLTLLAKGHKYNSVPLHENLTHAFSCYEEQLKALSDAICYTALVQSPYLFPSKKESTSPLSVRTLHDIMLKLSKELERPLHAHLFRHTFASYCIAAHMDISTVSSLISHSNPSITLAIYTHEIESTQKQKEIKKLTFERN